MKPLRILTLAVALAVVVGVAASRPASASVSFSFFFSNLAPHGSWVVSGSYGRVWQPSVYHAGWNPYYDGHWQYTDAGWCWDSDYAWGDIPYHYGTWVMDAAYGWVWVPGYTWAPSWVEFRQGPDYIGWAPVAPSFSVGVSFGFGGGYYHSPSSFVFVHSHDFLCDHVRSYAVPHSQVNVIVNNTKIINNNIHIENNVVVNRGPDVRSVERATRRHIDAIPIDRSQSVRRLDMRGVSRQDIRVNDRFQRDGRGLRAAEPVPASRPLPSGRQDRDGRFNGNRTDVRDGVDRNGGSDRFDPNNRADRSERFDSNGRTPRSDRFDRRETPDRRSMPDSTPSRREDLQRGRDRQDIGTAGDSLGRRGMERSPRSDFRSRPSFESPGDRYQSRERDRSAASAGPRVREPNGDRAQGRPDEGRMFRGVRERQPAPHADRSAPQHDRMSSRPEPRSSGQPRGTDRTDRSRRSGGRPKEHKDHDRK